MSLLERILGRTTTANPSPSQSPMQAANSQAPSSSKSSKQQPAPSEPKPDGMDFTAKQAFRAYWRHKAQEWWESEKQKGSSRDFLCDLCSKAITRQDTTFLWGSDMWCEKCTDEFFDKSWMGYMRMNAGELHQALRFYEGTMPADQTPSKLDITYPKVSFSLKDHEHLGIDTSRVTKYKINQDGNLELENKVVVYDALLEILNLLPIRDEVEHRRCQEDVSRKWGSTRYNQEGNAVDILDTLSTCLIADSEGLGILSLGPQFGLFVTKWTLCIVCDGGIHCIARIGAEKWLFWRHRE